MQQLFKKITEFHQLSPRAVAVLEKNLLEVQMEKSEYIIREGKVCQHLYFLDRGLVRGFYNVDGKELTHWFGFENDFITSFHSFITGEPSLENIQPLEPCTLWMIEKSKLEKLYEENHDIERLVRIAYEKYYIRLEERYVKSQFKTAAQLYEELVNNSPHILQRVPLGYIASYLGISQETLSRIRSKY